MEIFQVIVLALIQGLTEFLPISSSAHLILPAQLLGWQDQGLAFDVAVHLGSLLAVVYYFRDDLIRLFLSFTLSIGGLRRLPDRGHDVRLAWQVVLATLPAVVAALTFGDIIETHLRSVAVIATTTIVFGLLLGVAEWRARSRVQPGIDIVSLTWVIAIGIGIAQMFALIPGTSRSGVTMTMAILLGMSRTAGARFSFLLSIPIILAAGSYAGLELLHQPQTTPWVELCLAVAVSAVSAWFCIAVFMRLIERIGMMPFVFYRLLLGFVLFAFFV